MESSLAIKVWYVAAVMCLLHECIQTRGPIAMPCSPGEAAAANAAVDMVWLGPLIGSMDPKSTLMLENCKIPLKGTVANAKACLKYDGFWWYPNKTSIQRTLSRERFPKLSVFFVEGSKASSLKQPCKWDAVYWRPWKFHQYKQNLINTPSLAKSQVPTINPH